MREIGDRRADGKTLGKLGLAHFALGEHRHATKFHEQSVTIAREVGDRSSEGTALLNLALALNRVGENSAAIEHLSVAAKILDEIEDPDGARAHTLLDEWRRAT